MLGYPSKSVVALASFCLFSLGVASGQQPLIPADGDYVHFGTDSVNLQNFAIGLSVTVTDKQGLIPFKYTLEGTNECFGAVNGASHSAVCGFMNVANGAHNCLIKTAYFCQETLAYGFVLNSTTTTTGTCAADGGSFTKYSGLTLQSPGGDSFRFPHLWIHGKVQGATLMREESFASEEGRDGRQQLARDPSMSTNRSQCCA